ncbi:MAG: TonB-dependent receptor, partial [Verrucomicrobia bacterium]|nr:TonB-dependent receptor [Verrucomicrobiota bacterium]
LQSYRTSDGHRDYADGEVQDYFGRIGYAINENWNVGLLFESTLSSAHDPGSVIPPITRNGRFDVTDYFGIVSATHTYEAAEGYVKFYWDKGALDWVDQYNTTTLKNNTDTFTRYNNYGVKARETFHLWEGGEILAGSDLDYISGSVHNVAPPAAPTDFGTETFRVFSPHFALSQQFDITETIYVKPSAGFRYMFHDQFRDEMAPQAGVLLHMKDTEFHANYGRGVDYPGIFTAGAMFPTGKKWQQLIAETVNHYEVGVSHNFDKLVKLDCNLFSDESSDRVMFAVPPFPPVWSNAGKTKSKGIETAVTVTPTKDLALFAGFTYLNSDPTAVPYSPPWSASAGVTYRFLQHFRISLDSVFVDSQYVTSWARNVNAVTTARVDSYMLVNARLSYDFQVPAWKLDGQIFLAAENLTDIYYEQRTGYPMPGINGMGGFKVRF